MNTKENNKNYLKGLFTQYWLYLAVYTSCKLNIFEALREKKGLDELAVLLNLDRVALKLLLSALVKNNFLYDKNETYQLSPLGELLCEESLDSLKYACLNWGGEHLSSWQNLELSIKSTRVLNKF